eukprot:5912638-Ditylum_brightwellii.AAC.1
MMTQILGYMETHFNTIDTKQDIIFSTFIHETSSKIEFNQESIKKFESDLNNISLTIPKIEDRLSKEEEIYRAQCQNITNELQTSLLMLAITKKLPANLKRN